MYFVSHNAETMNCKKVFSHVFVYFIPRGIEISKVQIHCMCLEWLRWGLRNSRVGQEYGTKTQNCHRNLPIYYYLGLMVQHRLAGEAYIFCYCTFFFIF